MLMFDKYNAAVYCDSKEKTRELLQFLENDNNRNDSEIKFMWKLGSKPASNEQTWNSLNMWDYGLIFIENGIITFLRNYTVANARRDNSLGFDYIAAHNLTIEQIYTCEEYVAKLLNGKGGLNMPTEEIRYELPETLMDVSETYELEEEEREELKKEIIDLLHEYDYSYPSHIMDVIDEWVRQKGWLIKLFMKHPGYIKGKFQIKLDAQLYRKFASESVSDFRDWFFENFEKTIIEKYEKKIGFFSYRDIINIKCDIHCKRNRLYNILSLYEDYYSDLKDKTKDEIYTFCKAKYDELMKEELRLENRQDEFLKDARQISIWSKYMCLQADLANEVLGFEGILKSVVFSSKYNSLDTPHLFNEEEIERIKSYYNDYDIQKPRCPQVGQKKTRFVLQVAKRFGIDKIVDLKERTWTDENGEFHSRMDDKGWNYRFAQFSDAITPREYPRTLIMSVNLVDFLTASFGKDWASCMTIDKDNKRECHSTYSGCYSSGTLSYGCDKHTFMIYDPTTDDKEFNLPYELKSKVKRCLFQLGEDKLVQGRLYPDGRDGGDDSLAAQYRAIVQREIAELYDTPNLWLLKKGTSECCSVINSDGTHYKDYAEYSDCNVSYLRRIDGLVNTKEITVGSQPICPVCGERHWREDNIQCDEDCECHVCSNCGEHISRNDYEVIEIDGNYYCDSECAEEAGYVYTEDDGWRRRSDCYYEESTERWYYYSGDDINTDDGKWFYSSYTANEYGYYYSEYDDVWTDEDNIFFAPWDETFSSRENEDWICGVKENGDAVYFPNEEVANNNGWYFNEVEDFWTRR